MKVGAYPLHPLCKRCRSPFFRYKFSYTLLILLAAVKRRRTVLLPSSLIQAPKIARGIVLPIAERVSGSGNEPAEGGIHEDTQYISKGINRSGSCGHLRRVVGI